jgi:hypothetical protein
MSVPESSTADSHSVNCLFDGATMQLRLIVLLLSLLVVTGCTRSETSQKATNTDALRTEHPSPTPATSSTSPPIQQSTIATDSTKVKAKLDACAMLTSQDIESVQGEALRETKLSGGSADGFNVSQCFFTLPTFTKSISLAITQRAEGPGARDPQQFWKDNFHQDKERKKDRDREKDREEESEERPPQKISGIGDEAFWMASRAAGILYVLKGSSYIRISIGGGGDQQTKIKKSKALAQKVIDRL